MKGIRSSIVAGIAVAVIGLAVLGSLDAQTLPVAAVFATLIILARLSRLFSYADVVAIAAGVAAYADLEASRGSAGIRTLAAACAVFLGIWLVARLIERSTRQTEESLSRTARMVDDLTMYEPDGRVLRPRFGEQAVVEEVKRARRAGESFCLVLVDAGEEDRDAGEDHTAMIGVLLRETLRETDRVARLDGSLHAAILPTTDIVGGNEVASKVQAAARLHGVPSIRCAVASFPDDAVTAQELFAETRAALELGRQMGLPLVSAGMLRRE